MPWLLRFPEEEKRKRETENGFLSRGRVCVMYLRCKKNEILEGDIYRD